MDEGRLALGGVEMTMSPREVIAKALMARWAVCEDGYTPTTNDEADAILQALDEQGMAVVPKEPRRAGEWPLRA
jgi:hypothetical protein